MQRLLGPAQNSGGQRVRRRTGSGDAQRILGALGHVVPASQPAAGPSPPSTPGRHPLGWGSMSWAAPQETVRPATPRAPPGISAAR
jgi:hypothetical protein